MSDVEPEEEEDKEEYVLWSNDSDQVIEDDARQGTNRAGTFVEKVYGRGHGGQHL